MCKGVLFGKKADFVGRFRLKPAFLKIQHLVEEFAHMEAKAAEIGGR